MAHSSVDQRTTVGLLFGLTAVSGLVDAVSYLRLGHVFVANMTGNIVFLGLSAGPKSGLHPGLSLTALGGFLAGALCGGQLAAALDARPRRWIPTALALQGTVMAFVAILFGAGVLGADGGRRYGAVVALAVALGIQNSTVRHMSEADLTTTVLTQTLTGLAADSALAHGPGAHLPRRLGSVVVMLGGAAVGAALLRISATAVIALAAGVVLLAAIGFAVGPPEAPSSAEGAATPS